MGFLINPFWTAAAAAAPDNIGIPFRWYDAASYALADTASITTADPWIDQSVNLSNATTTLTFEPSFHHNIFGILPAVRLQTPEHLAFDSGEFTLSDLTIICIAKINGDSIWLSRSGLNRQVRAFRGGTNNYSFYPGSGAEVISGTLTNPATDARMNIWRRNTGTGDVDFFENDTNEAGGTNGDAIALNQIGIIDGGPLNIDIGELVIYDSFISTVNIQAVYDDYFKPKFGLP